MAQTFNLTDRKSLSSSKRAVVFAPDGRSMWHIVTPEGVRTDEEDTKETGSLSWEELETGSRTGNA